MPRLLPILTITLLTANAFAQDRAQPLIHDAIDENKLFTLSGSTRPEMNAKNDRGAAPDALRLETMILQLKRAPEHEAALVRFIEAQHDRSSPSYHHWLTAKQFGARYGAAQADRDKVTAWLKQKGFTVNAGHKSGMVIAFSGTAAQVRSAFHTEIHMIDVGGTRYFANAGDPSLPAALAPVVVGVVSLHNLPSKHVEPAFDPANSLVRNLAPGDITRIYNIDPLFAEKIIGSGQTIAVVGISDIVNDDWFQFRKMFGLKSGGSLKVLHPSTGIPCIDPGILPGASTEASLDVEWSSATAPGATIELASCLPTATAGEFIALLNLLDADKTPDIISMSFGQAEAIIGSTDNAAAKSAYENAVAMGISVFVATGDQGSTTADPPRTLASHGIAVNGRATTQFNVAVGGTDFRDTLDGDADDFWNKTNDSTFRSVKSYVPEMTWNDACASELFAQFEGFSSSVGPQGACNSPKLPGLRVALGAGGGPSACASGAPSDPGVVSGTCKGTSKPSWQKGVGQPDDGVRDVPDVSLFSANGLFRHSLVVCQTTTDAKGTHPCTADPNTWTPAGGTSFAAPMMAGIQALVNQHEHGRQGLPTFVYYQLAAKQYGASYDSSCEATLGAKVGSSCVFHDVISGDIASACGPLAPEVSCTNKCSTTDGVCMQNADDAAQRQVCVHQYEACNAKCPQVAPPDCYLPSGAAGVTSKSNGQLERAFSAGKRYDLATGLGSVNAFNLVQHWDDVPGAPPTPKPPSNTTNQQCLDKCTAADGLCMNNAHDSAERQACAHVVELCDAKCK